MCPTLALIESFDARGVVSNDRAGQPLVPQTIEIPYPPNPQMIELNVTRFVNEARQRKLPFAAFRIAAVCDQAECESDTPQNFYFGGSTNVWSWPKSEPPLLELSP